MTRARIRRRWRPTSKLNLSMLSFCMVFRVKLRLILSTVVCGPHDELERDFEDELEGE
jgi:hypothetical protein